MSGGGNSVLTDSPVTFDAKAVTPVAPSMNAVLNNAAIFLLFPVFIVLYLRFVFLFHSFCHIRLLFVELPLILQKKYKGITGKV